MASRTHQWRIRLDFESAISAASAHKSRRDMIKFLHFDKFPTLFAEHRMIFCFPFVLHQFNLI